jgi:hypothetical protein
VKTTSSKRALSDSHTRLPGLCHLLLAAGGIGRAELGQDVGIGHVPVCTYAIERNVSDGRTDHGTDVAHGVGRALTVREGVAV